MQEIDCRNLPCPGPVIKTKKSLENAGGQPVRIIVDGGAARENVTRFAAGKGYDITEEQLADGYALTIHSSTIPQVPEKALSGEGGIILVASDKLGNGPDELGQLLMKNFLISLLEINEPPEKVFFINSGVLLAIDGAETTEPLGKLAAAGVEILSCGVCLDFFSVRERLAVGSVTNMLTIAESMLNGRVVIRL